MSSIGWLIVSLGVILIGAEVFVNGVEWLGKKLDLSEGAVGSVLAAVGTALPETIIPIIAIVFGNNGVGHEIGIGAILGAPLMLATLAMFVTGAAVIIFRRRRNHGIKVVADYSTMARDLSFFMVVFLVAVLTGLFPTEWRIMQLAVAVLMIVAYFIYVFIMIKEERDVNVDEDIPPCYFARKQESPHLLIILSQVLVALAFIILGANLFVDSVKEVAALYAVPAFILAIIITPIATELPEKFNSIIWVSREKDTLALGNITGAMVFQSSLIPAIGIFLTDWQLSAGALLSAGLALLSALFIYIELLRKKHITAGMLLMGGLFYLLFILGVIEGLISW
ncbi:MAG: sodium:calcium antiporter [Syntrophomonadaceae bacterium]|nr:sodium:calcium antiporter [Syntrophomonadaceae bacterium]